MATPFSKLAQLYSALEETPSYNKKRKILSNFFKKLNKKEIASATYLTLGRIGPINSEVDLGLGQKMLERAVAQAYNVSQEEVRTKMKNTGDLGLVAQSLDSKKRSNLTINQVRDTLIKIQQTSGQNSQQKKLGLLSNLLKKANST